ncbi:MAG: HDOD domain-containing protein [Planctomycetota bacterium]
MIDSAITLDYLATRSGQLYSLPGVAMQVLQLTRNSHVDTRALKECIENDPAISSRILRVVNSSLFGLSREVSDLNQALALLGLKPLKLLVLGFSLPSGLFLDVESKTLLWYWKHTLTKAVAGRELSHRLWQIPGDEAFLAGLFQDLGVLLLFQQLGQPYARFLDRAVSHHLDLGAIEQRAMGFSHTELSARLLRQWKFPDALCDAVAWQPVPGEHRPALAQILHLSELFARLFADGQTSALAELLQTGRHYCHHLDQQLEPLVQEIELKVNELADIFSLALPDGLEYRDVLAEAHRQMAGVATQAAEDLLRNRFPEHDDDSDEDWLSSDLDSLSNALNKVCAAPIECEPAAAKAKMSAEPSDARQQPRPPATGSSAVRPTVAVTPAFQAKTRPAAGSVAPNLLDRLTGIVALCRPARRPLSLLLVKLSAGDDLLTLCGPREIATLQQVLGKVCTKLDHPGAICLPHTEFGFALILPGAERQQAIELGNELLHTVRALAMSAGVTQQEWLKLDVGVATVAQAPKNFPPRDLLDGADRCLYASHASGGGVVKSIEIY